MTKSEKTPVSEAPRGPQTESCEVHTLFCNVGGIEQPVLSVFNDDEDGVSKLEAKKQSLYFQHGPDCKFRIETDKNRVRNKARSVSF